MWIAVLVACGKHAVPDPGVLVGDVGADVAVCAPERGGFTLAIDNPFFPLVPGAVAVLEGGGERVQQSVLDEVEVVAGVSTRVFEEREWDEGVLVEVSRNFFVQTAGGTVCYYGEDVDIYENDVVVAHEGAWRAGIDGAVPGIQVPANPAVGQTFKEESAPGIAEDTAEITAIGDTKRVPAGTFTDTVTVVESSPLDRSTSTKVYARGVGMIFDSGIELVP
jgi:hypothetical protein